MNEPALYDRARERLLRSWSPTDEDGLAEEALEAALDQVTDLVHGEGPALDDAAVADLRARLALDALGLGPVASFALDPATTEILVNGPRHVFVERGGVMTETDLRLSPVDVRTMMTRMMAFGVGRRLDASTPFVDLSLPFGMRVNIVIPPAVVGGPHITIRRHVGALRTLDDLRERGMFDPSIQTWLEGCVASHANVLISGASGSGKTTLLDKLARAFDPKERIVTIEDTLELRIDKPDVVRLTTRPPNVEGKGEITIGDLFRTALRMHPSRILLGEIRGKEALDYLAAINSGHRGTFAVIHAASPEEALVRIEHLVANSAVPVAATVLRRQVAHGLDAIVQVTQLPDGSRRVTRVSEVVGLLPDGEVELRDVYVWVSHARAPDGRLLGSWRTTGATSRVARRFHLAGAPLPEGLPIDGV